MSVAAPADGALWLIGAGNMGGAMLHGWLAAGREPSGITVIDPGTPRLPPPLVALASPPLDGAVPAMLVLAVKPQLLDTVASIVAPLLAPDTLLVSILAGVEIASLRQRFAVPRAIVRVMPNTPVALRKGVLALFGDGLEAADRARAEALMAPLGLVEWIGEEALFDAVTALSGCGPAFLFRFVDALGAAGAALGLPADQAARLALATVEGAALLAAAADEPPATLADRVASPGGSTREGLDMLDRDDALAKLLEATLAAAAARNRAMAAAARG